MQHFTFDPNALPGCASPSRAQVGWERFAASTREDETLHAFTLALESSPAGVKLARAVFGNSPFLTACWLNDPQFTKELLEQGPDAMRDKALAATRNWDRNLDQSGLMRHLRIQKLRIALITAIADLTGVWDLFAVTRALSDFADAAVSAAASQQLLQLDDHGKIKLKHREDPERESGLVILGMGKLGGYELNYSSDIDLIILFDVERIQTNDPMELQTSFVRLARGIVEILDKRTGDGYVFRTDLRLRPDPGSTPLAISTLAAEVYYESIGQNWERAAMIKARPIAGDLDAGHSFLKILKPYVWRKSLDFAAIQDIQSIKRQINAHKGGNTIKVKGHNVKLGRGGIREIEFYAQTQQLIWGGRERELRIRSTCDALNALLAAGHETAKNVSTLIDAYTFLRRVEHRLQMIDDAQTHSLPENDEDLKAVAIFLGYPNYETFADAIVATLSKVEALYAKLFEDENPLGAEDGGSLVFTGGESDPETLRTLRELGYKNPEAVDAAVRGWHHARYRATRSTRAREILTELMPSIISAMAKTAEPDAAFMRFDAFLGQLPAGVQLFSMFQSNPQMLDLIAEIMGTAPRLAEHLARKAGILDVVLTPGFLDALPSAQDMAADLQDVLAEATCMEEVLDLARRWAKDHKFQVGVQVLKGTIDERESQRALTQIAETLLNTLQPLVENDFAIHHGRIPGGGLSVVAFGKLGGAEKTPTSDMDLIFIYTCGEGVETSDGKKPLSVSQYFARLSQRLINALSAPTAEGALYEVDMRLRPSGNAGPIATTLAAFEAYQKHDAWTWEHMALTRARPVTGPNSLKAAIAEVIKNVLCAKRDTNKLVVNVADMRLRMDAERHTDVPWSIKNYRGGLVDVEFISQYLQLCHAHAHPEILNPNTRTALENLKHAELLDAPTANGLIQALDLWQALQGLLRLTISAPNRSTDIGVMPESLKRQISLITDTPSVQAAEEKIRATAVWVLETFERLIMAPAETARPTVKTDLGVAP